MVDKFYEFMQNAWVIGIAGGTISGIIVYYITVYFLAGKRNRDFKRNITLANNAVLNLLRPYIANSGLPDRKALKAIINSISRQYGVKCSEMNPISAFYEDLVVEFVSNLYIPDEVKKRNIEKLLESINALLQEETIKSVQEQRQVVKSKNVQAIGGLVGLSSAALSILSGIVLSSNGKGSFNFIVGIISIVVVVFVVVVIGICSCLRTYRLERISKDRSIVTYNPYIDLENIKMQNCGTDINDSFDTSFSFLNYFEDE